MIFAVLGSLGGVVVFLSAVVVIVRGIFNLINSTDDNTQAVKRLTEKMDELTKRTSDSEVKIAIIEDRMKHAPRLRLDSIRLHRAHARYCRSRRGHIHHGRNTRLARGRGFMVPVRQHPRRGARKTGYLGIPASRIPAHDQGCLQMLGATVNNGPTGHDMLVPGQVSWQVLTGLVISHAV